MYKNEYYNYKKKYYKLINKNVIENDYKKYNNINDETFFKNKFIKYKNKYLNKIMWWYRSYI